VIPSLTSWESFSSEIQNLERKRGQYQDSWVFRGLSELNVASKPRYCRTSEKSRVEVFGL